MATGLRLTYWLRDWSRFREIRPAIMTPTDQRPQSTEQGFSLLETLIAIVVLSISLLALAQLLMVSLEQTKFAEFNTKGIQVALMKLEDLRGQYNNQIETGTEPADLTAGSHGPETVTLENVGTTIQSLRQFEVSWTVANQTGGAKSITVSVEPPANADVRLNKTISLSSNFAP